MRSPLPALLVACRGVRRGVVYLVPSCGAVPLVARRPFSVSVGGLLALRGSSRLIGAGGGAWSLVAVCLLGWGWRWSVWIMWSALFSVDCFGGGVYINSRAWMLFSPFFVSWHMLVVRAVLWFSAPPIALVYAPINRFLRGTTGAIFYQSSSHLIISRLLACGFAFFLLPGYSHINIAPLLAPLLSTR